MPERIRACPNPRRLVLVSLIVAQTWLGSATADDRGTPRRSLKGTESRLAQAAFESHNRMRIEANLKPLTRNPQLDASATAHAKEMASRREMSHVGADGSMAAQRIDREHYPYQRVGENVARGQRSAEHVMKGWEDSPGHLKNILGDYTEVGLAVALDEDGNPFWCVNFATPWPRIRPADTPNAVLDALNRERHRHHLEPFRIDARLNTLAATRAASLAKIGPARDSPGRRQEFEAALRKSGYPYQAIMELAAGGLPGPKAFVDSLITDPSRSKSVLDSHLDIGVGYATGHHGTPYWCLILGSARN